MLITAPRADREEAAKSKEQFPVVNTHVLSDPATGEDRARGVYNCLTPPQVKTGREVVAR